MRKWIAVYPLCGGLNTLLDIAVIFKRKEKEMCLVTFYINSFFRKVFKETNYCQFVQSVFCLRTHNLYGWVYVGVTV